MEVFLGKRCAPDWYKSMDMITIQTIATVLFMFVWLCVLIGGLPDVRNELDKLQGESESEDMPETSETESVVRS
jgi:hypothetical protein